MSDQHLGDSSVPGRTPPPKAMTRDPSGPIAKVGRVGGWTTLLSFLIPLVIPGLQPLMILPLAGFLTGMIGAAGSEIRNHQFTYETGQKRGHLLQSGGSAFFLNLLGQIL